MGHKSRPLSAVDSAWLHMDDPTNLMMVTGIALLDGPIDYARYRRTLEARLLPFERFTMRVVESRGLTLSGPHWEPDPHFALDAHIHRVALPSPGDMAALQDLLSDLSSMPLDFSKPLWQVHLVENVLGGSAMILRFHHCIGDGTAMNAVMHRLMDTSPDAPVEPPAAPGNPAHHGWNPLGALLAPVRATFDSSMKIAGDLLHEGVETIRHPSHLLDLTRNAANGSAALGRALIMAPDPITPFKGPLGVQKRVAWSEPVPLDVVKQIGKQHDAKVNDVLLAAVAGALRSYLLDRGSGVTDLEIRAVIPVDLRPPQRALELGNMFGLVFLALPLGLDDPLARLTRVKRRMDEIKRSPEALIFFGLLAVFGMTPSQIEEPVVNLFGSKATAVMTNVPGPRQPLYLAGSRISNMMFWVPQAGRLGMGVSILSYNGAVTVGVIADAGLVPDPQMIAANFQRAFVELQERSCATPGGAPRAGSPPVPQA